MIIGLSGYARSGKDSVADYLVERHGFVKMSFADPIREALLRLNPMITLTDNTRSPLATLLRFFSWEELKDCSEEVRPLMQRMGTEVGRQMFGEDFWVDQAMFRAMQKDKVVFADVRFRNEATAVNRNWGYNWRINRPGVGPANDHPSETELDNYQLFDSVIENDLTLKSLYKKTDLLIEEIYG